MATISPKFFFLEKTPPDFFVLLFLLPFQTGFIRQNENRLNVFNSPDEVLDGFDKLLQTTIEGNLKWLNTI